MDKKLKKKIFVYPNRSLRLVTMSTKTALKYTDADVERIVASALEKQRGEMKSIIETAVTTAVKAITAVTPVAVAPKTAKAAKAAAGTRGKSGYNLWQAATKAKTETRPWIKKGDPGFETSECVKYYNDLAKQLNGSATAAAPVTAPVPAPAEVQVESASEDVMSADELIGSDDDDDSKQN